VSDPSITIFEDAHDAPKFVERYNNPPLEMLDATLVRVEYIGK
jgi:hypothetical protein